MPLPELKCPQAKQFLSFWLSQSKLRGTVPTFHGDLKKMSLNFLIDPVARIFILRTTISIKNTAQINWNRKLRKLYALSSGKGRWGRLGRGRWRGGWRWRGWRWRGWRWRGWRWWGRRWRERPLFFFFLFFGFLLLFLLFTYHLTNDVDKLLRNFNFLLFIFLMLQISFPALFFSFRVSVLKQSIYH